MPRYTVCLDPGHASNIDTGAQGNGLREEDITLVVAQRAQGYLTARGVNTVMTRTMRAIGATSVQESLSRRVLAAQQAQANAFVSIHCNAAADPSANGTETYAYRPGGQGEALARAVHESVMVVAGTTDRGVKFADFYVLRETPMPACLIELGFITHPDDAQRLSSPAWQDRVAQAIAEGVCRFLGVSSRPEPAPAQAAGEAPVAAGTPILGPAQATVEQARVWARSRGATEEFVGLADLYWELAPERGGVRPEVAYAQAAKETGFGWFGRPRQ